MFKIGFHPFHIVSLSPWPLLGSVSLLSLLGNTFFVFKGESMWWSVVGSFSTVLVLSQWWRDIVRESTYSGDHTREVTGGLKMGVILFIISEIMFFFSFFFGYFSTSLSPDVEIGMKWPPSGVQPISFLVVPLLNTLFLLSSGVSITWAHHGLITGQYFDFILGTFITIFQGGIFLVYQFLEYWEMPFSIADSVFGSFFFILTGFHGIHVFVGVTFIVVSWVRGMKSHFSSLHHFGYESAAWYWHFVDVVWLFLFILVYWWGS